MEYKQVLDLMDKLDQSSLDYLNFAKEDFTLELSKTPLVKSKTVNESQVPSPLTSETNVEYSHQPQEDTASPLKSPMVGIAYMQANPGDEPFVRVGDRVEQGDVVLIIEAMKMMTEIPAHISGVITELNVNNEDLVEYDQVLVRIQPE